MIRFPPVIFSRFRYPVTFILILPYVAGEGREVTSSQWLKKAVTFPRNYVPLTSFCCLSTCMFRGSKWGHVP